jgi:predicted dehydrogenase
VEKPLCLSIGELTEIQSLVSQLSTQNSQPFLMVGFNRRFAPQVAKMKSLLQGVTEPKAMIMTVNAGAIPADHWTQDVAVGGGRMIGEGCHFIDLLRFLAASPIVSVRSSVCEKPGMTGCRDTVTVSLGFADGSVGSLHYFANGDKGFPKERLEVFSAGRVLQLDNFRRLSGHGWKGFSKMNLWNQDKGHAAEMAALVGAVSDGRPSPIPFDEIVEVTRASFVAAGVLSEM